MPIVNDTRLCLEAHLQGRPQPVYDEPVTFLGLIILGTVTLELPPYRIMHHVSLSETEVWCNGQQVYPENLQVIRSYYDFEEADGSYTEGFSSDDEVQDFTACSVDDCGYCGKCMY